MTWNYRIVKDEDNYIIHEVYYDDQGNIENYSAKAIHPQGETLFELKSDLEKMLKASELPIIDLKDLENKA